MQSVIGSYLSKVGLCLWAPLLHDLCVIGNSSSLLGVKVANVLHLHKLRVSAGHFHQSRLPSATQSMMAASLRLPKPQGSLCHLHSLLFIKEDTQRVAFKMLCQKQLQIAMPNPLTLEPFQYCARHLMELSDLHITHNAMKYWIYVLL